MIAIVVSAELDRNDTQAGDESIYQVEHAVSFLLDFYFERETLTCVAPSVYPLAFSWPRHVR